MYQYLEQKSPSRESSSIITKYYEEEISLLILCASNIGNSWNRFIGSMRPPSGWKIAEQLTIFLDSQKICINKCIDKNSPLRIILTFVATKCYEEKISYASNIGNSWNRFIGSMRPPSGWKIAEQLRIEKLCL